MWCQRRPHDIEWLLHPHPPPPLTLSCYVGDESREARGSTTEQTSESKKATQRGAGIDSCQTRFGGQEPQRRRIVDGHFGAPVGQRRMCPVPIESMLLAAQFARGCLRDAQTQFEQGNATRQTRPVLRHRELGVP